MADQILAREAIQDVYERFGQAYLDLAYHAAMPLALTPDLLYHIWANFQRDVIGNLLHIPWIAVADLLLSPLCQEIGYETYSIEDSIRDLLLQQMQQDPRFQSNNKSRLVDLAEFLRQYVTRELDSPQRSKQEVAQAQQWAAFAYTQPERLVKSLAESYAQLQPTDRSQLLRLAALTQTFVEPLSTWAKPTDDVQIEFNKLLNYGRGLANLTRGNLEGAATQFEAIGLKDQIQVGGVELRIPKEVFIFIKNKQKVDTSDIAENTGGKTIKHRFRDEHLFGPGPKRILALDGGGIRGALILGYLQRIETMLRQRFGGDPDFRLCDYFDLIGGTSTGAFIAAGLALGFSVEQLQDAYQVLSKETFKKSPLNLGVWGSKFPTEPLMKVLAQYFGDNTLGSDSLRTGLMVTAKRLDTGSPWMFHNNPRGKYFSPRSRAEIPSREYLLREILRASMAAPHYFEPEEIQVAQGEVGAFVDGGISPYNNPSLQLLMLATMEGYNLDWSFGEDELLLVSVGTGYRDVRLKAKEVLEMPAIQLALQSVMSIMGDCDWLTQRMLQWMSHSATPWKFDSEIGDLQQDILGDGPALVSYLRYNVAFDPAWLKKNLNIDISQEEAESLFAMDNSKNVQKLFDLGAQASNIQVQTEHFPHSFDLDQSGQIIRKSATGKNLHTPTQIIRNSEAFSDFNTRLHKTRDEHLFGLGPKRILAIDGGGIRGALTLGYLERIEGILRQRFGGDPDFRLCDYFDLIGGTSTGAFIAAGLALGFSVEQLQDAYQVLSKETFKKSPLNLGVWGSKFPTEPLMKVLAQYFGDNTLGSDSLRTGLMVTAKRLDTGSPWMFHNNPRGKYFSPRSRAEIPSREYLLREILRASMAAPHYFEPEEIQVAQGEVGAFVDGGISPYNNPSLQLLMLATMEGYNLDWSFGEDELLLVSVGTGYRDVRLKAKEVLEMPAIQLALQSVMSIMGDCDWLTQRMLQWMSHSATPWKFDSEIGDLQQDILGDGPALVSYLRYNVAFDPAWLKKNLNIDISQEEAESLFAMDNSKNVQKLFDLGAQASNIQVQTEHFPHSFDIKNRQRDIGKNKPAYFHN